MVAVRTQLCAADSAHMRAPGRRRTINTAEPTLAAPGPPEWSSPEEMELCADDEVARLAESLGLSEPELRLNLGLPAPQPARSDADRTLDSLVEMFPHVPRADVRAALADSGNDSERAAEQLLSWEALRPEIDAVDEIGQRKLRKAAKTARKETQRQNRERETEDRDVRALEEILDLPASASRELYLANGRSVTDAVLAKCMVTATAMPTTQQQAVVTMESRNEYTGLSQRELQEKLRGIDAQLANLRERARKYAASPATRVLTTDSYQDLRTLMADRRCVERALNRERFFRNAVHTQHRIDLHGLTLDNAQSVCRELVLDFKTGDATALEIVTGAGRHSANGRSVIKEWLRGYLKAERVRAEELEGSFVLRKKAY